MGARLELKYGLVAEADRLSDSADTMLVEEPATGSKSRSKGNLYLVVSSAKVGGRAREATALVAETIRREYYYDESAGIPICLEKAVRRRQPQAARQPRGQRAAAGRASASRSRSSARTSCTWPRSATRRRTWCARRAC